MNKISIKTEGESFNCFNLLQFGKPFLTSNIGNLCWKAFLHYLLNRIPWLCIISKQELETKWLSVAEGFHIHFELFKAYANVVF